MAEKRWASRDWNSEKHAWLMIIVRIIRKKNSSQQDRE
jgi:hypothetical protein